MEVQWHVGLTNPVWKVRVQDMVSYITSINLFYTPLALLFAQFFKFYHLSRRPTNMYEVIFEGRTHV